MNDIERKALELVNKAANRRRFDLSHCSYDEVRSALCRAIEQHEAFRQEVSDAIDSSILTPETEAHLARFIIAKPDPLVEALEDMKDGRAGPTTESYAACLRAALAKRNGRIVFDD